MIGGPLGGLQLSAPSGSKPRAVPLVATRWQACLLPELDSEKVAFTQALGRGGRGGPLCGEAVTQREKAPSPGYTAGQVGPWLEPWTSGPRPVLLASSSPAVLPSHPHAHLPENLS